MTDDSLALYADPRYAACYDAFFPWEEREDFHFYLPMVMAARSVLDVGCGTGMLLHRAREAGHTGRLVGLDPAEGMLARARRRADVDWRLGDLRSVSFAGRNGGAGDGAGDGASDGPNDGANDAELDGELDGEFDLIVMTGHAFQELGPPDETRAALAAVRAALADGGRFAFETRNPAVRGWERWDLEYTLAVPDPAGSGGVARMTIRTGAPVTGDVVHAVTTVTGPAWPRPRTSRSAFRFPDAEAVTALLHEAGLRVSEQWGDFDGSPLTVASEEIITVARRA